MNKRIFFYGLALLMVVVVAGCSKDKYASKPSLTLKSISSYDIPRGGLFEMRLEYTDAEGDLRTTDSSLTIRRRVLRCPSDSALFPFRLPSVPTSKNASGEIVIRWENGTSNYLSSGYATYPSASCANRTSTDTTYFRFYIKDAAGNISDTLTLDKPVLIHK